MKMKVELEKMDVHVKMFLEFIKHLQKGRVMDINKLQVNDSRHNEGTICLVNE